MGRVFGLICAFVGISVSSNVSIAAPPSFMGLGDLPGGSIYSVGLAVSGDGLIAVGRSDSTWSDGNGEAFRWRAMDGMTGLGALEGAPYRSFAKAVSYDGSVIVGSGNGQEAMRWTESNGMAGLGILPGGTSSLATAVSWDGEVVVGQSGSSSGGQAFRWTPQTGMTALGNWDAHGISGDGQVIVGGGQGEGVRWNAQSGLVFLGDLPGGGTATDAVASSMDGSVIVGRGMSEFGEEAFRWENGQMIGLGDLPGGQFRSYASGVSADGSVIVGRGVTTQNEEAFIWDAVHGMRNLREVLGGDCGLDLTGWRLQFAEDVSADGQTIVGWGINPSGMSEGWIAHTPEPATLGPLVLGSILALAPRRCRDCRSQP